MPDFAARVSPTLPRLFAAFLVLGGGFAAFSIMAADTQWRWGVPVTAVSLSFASAALFALMRGSPLNLDDAAARTPARALGRPVAHVASALLGWFFATAAAAAGRLSIIAAALLVPALFLWVVAAVFRLGVALGPWTLDEKGESRPLARRHGFWVIAAAAVLYLPTLGSHSLTDPWETHYGEVAREMLARNDWISTWWAQDGWFWSKPVLDFWMQALAMAVFGVGFGPDAVLPSGDAAHPARPEWAVRMPLFVLTVAALYLLYKAVAVLSGRRAGLLGALVLATMPQWFFLAHQTMTDMPMVAPFSAAMGLLLLGMSGDPERHVRSYAVQFHRYTFHLDAAYLVFGLILMTALPQILYLASRNVELQWVAAPHGFRPHGDTFWSGSAGNCGLPGNEPCAPRLPFARHFEPALQALLWAALLGVVLWINRRERRASRLCFLAGWYCLAVATMGKGPGALALAGAATLVYLFAQGDARKLLSLELPSGLLLIAILVLPWYVAMYVRHGPPFTDALVFHHMVERAKAHVHDTNDGDDVSFRYYVWQLGYAFFPWTGLVPAGLMAWMRRPEQSGRALPLPAVLFAAWFIFAFALFAAMPTKFHHYIFPAVPPAAMLTGLFLDRLLEVVERPERSDPHERLMLAGAAFAGAVLVGLVGRDLTHRPAPGDIEGQARLLHLFTYQYRRVFPDTLDFRIPITGCTIAAVVLSLTLAVERWRRFTVNLLTTVALVFASWALDVYLFRLAPHWGQRELFVRYYAERSGPDEPVIAYQMNWKGENFYTGNRIPAFASSGQPFVDYVRRQRERGTKTFFFVTEHSRTAALRNELGSPRDFELLIDRKINNKFTLVKARFD